LYILNTFGKVAQIRLFFVPQMIRVLLYHADLVNPNC
jgi:hypothetical protein